MMKSIIFWSIIGLAGFVETYEKHDNKHQGHHYNRLHYKHENTTQASQTSSVLENYAGFDLIFNSEKNMIGFVNVTEKVGMAGVAKGEGHGVIFLVDSNSGTVLRFQNISEGTKTQNKDLEGEIIAAFKKILGEYEYLDQKINGTTTDILTSSAEALGLLNNIYCHLGHRKAGDSGKIKNFLFIQRFFRLLGKVYLGPLKGLFEGIGIVPLKQNLNRFLTITTGLTKLFSRAVGGLKNIIKGGVKFEVNSLFNNKNGADVLVYILRQTGAKFDLASIWRNLLNNIEELLKIIQLLGGGESKNGVDETFGVIAHIWAALSLRLPITSLVQYLLEAASDEQWDNSDSDFTQIVKDIKNITDEQAKKYDNTHLLGPFVSFFTNLTGNTLIHEGVNVSELVEKWRRRDVIGGFTVVTQTLIKFGSPEKYTSILFHSFTAFLNSTSDPQALRRLIPQVSLDDFSGRNGTLWQQLSNIYNVDSLLKLGSNPNEILRNISTFSEFSRIFSGEFGRSFDFAKILNGSSISEYISRNVWKQPVKWTQDIIHDSTEFIKHIFWDPIQNIIPGTGGTFNRLPWLTIPPILGPGPVIPETTTKKKCEDDCDDKKSSTPIDSTTKASTEIEGNGSSALTTIVTDEDFQDDETKVTTEKQGTEKLSTQKIVTETTEDTVTTKKSCDDCGKKSTKASIDAEKTTEADIEFKNYPHHAHRLHHENKHQENHHQSKKHDLDIQSGKAVHNSRDHKSKVHHEYHNKAHHTNEYDKRIHVVAKESHEGRHNSHHEKKSHSGIHHVERKHNDKHETKHLKKDYIIET